jgi:nucleotide-binding universal stress UspA family protein
MTLTILVPLDGSALAGRALPYAVGLATAMHGRLVIAHARTAPGRSDAPGFDPEATAAALREQGLTAEARLVYCRRADDAAGALLQAARDAEADLIVMSTHGRGGLTRLVLGSVADRLFGRAEVPVLLVTSGCPTDWASDHGLQILVPVDGSELAEAAIEPAVKLAALVDAEILLVRIVSSIMHVRHRHGRTLLSSGDFEERDDAWQYLTRMADRVRQAGCRVSIWVLAGSAASTIAAAARTERMDLIAMTTHGRGGLSRFLLGSVADGVLRRSSVPVLLVRSGMSRASSVEPDVAQARPTGPVDNRIEPMLPAR